MGARSTEDSGRRITRLSDCGNRPSMPTIRANRGESMASNDSHAAWQNARSFTVTLLPAEGEPIQLADGLAELLEAVDLVSEWLAREDPERRGTTEIAI